MNSNEIFSQSDHLLDHGWKRVRLYKPPLKVAYAYESPQVDGPHIWIDAGIHGNEIAPIYAVAHIVNILQRLQDKYNLVYCPLLNRRGFDLNIRYPYKSKSNSSGRSVGDQSHQIAYVEQGQVIPPSGRPNNKFAFQLGEYVNTTCLTRPFSLVLDLHEDDYEALPPGGYIYTMGNISPKAEKVALDIFPKQNIPIINNSLTRWGEPINGIIKAPPNASLPELVIERSKANCSAITVETSTHLPLSDRINLHSAFVNHIPDLLSQN